MSTLIIIILIIFIIVNLLKKQTRTEQPKKEISVSFGSETPRSYSSVLNRLEQDISYIASNTYCEINVVVSVQKIDSTYCTVRGSFLADTAFHGINFIDGYSYNGSDHVTFKTNLATDFISPNEVKREMLIQFKWSYLQVYNEKFTILDHGDYINEPFISYSFTVKNSN